jgi:hypothetical protein
VIFSNSTYFHAMEKQQEDLNLASNVGKSPRVTSDPLPMNEI